DGKGFLQINQPASARASACVLTYAFDGAVYYIGSQDKAPTGSSRASLTKISASRCVSEDPNAAWISSDYMQTGGFHLSARAGGPQIQVESAVTGLLRQAGANLISVDESVRESQATVRVEIEAPDREAQRARAVDPKQAERWFHAVQLSQEQVSEQ